MRGFDRNGILTLVDGVRQGTDTGHILGTFIDPALIKQVEIIREPSALLYGSGAMGESSRGKPLMRKIYYVKGKTTASVYLPKAQLETIVLVLVAPLLVVATTLMAYSVS